MPKPRFTLTSNRQHEDRIQFSHVAVQRHVPVRSAPDHKFALVPRHRPPYLRIALEHVQCLDDLSDTRSRLLGLELVQMIEDAIEVVADLGCDFDASHRYFASLRAAGRFDFFPATRACRYERICAHAMVLPDAAISAMR